eukprot:TRINITY_DN6307_c0_g1_i2.p1 TRINITY_DN6307_c0_g1~~TRINITY_DN6307_c0_g1_i2.p1  ORF type:complete len:119 (+),score=13.78 TRINITY_DN6307_c0_g1_i2:333-689(+)
MIIFTFYENDLRDAVLSLNVGYVGGFLLNYALAIYFFLTCGKNPGFLGEARLVPLSKGNLGSYDEGNYEKKFKSKRKLRLKVMRRRAKQKMRLVSDQKDYLNTVKDIDLKNISVTDAI